MAVIYGTEGPDKKNGTAGNDTIHGWAKGGNENSPSGDDTLNGNAGNDNLKGGTGFDHLWGGAGNDTLYGHRGNDFLSSGGSNDKLYGQVGDDTLDGGLGTDTLTGGTGNDIYVVDSTKDTITEYFNAEPVYDDFGEIIGSIDLDIDIVQSKVSYTLGDNLENLTLTGLSNISGTGNALDNNITGNAGDNFLYGGEGDDELDGRLGIDTLMGGTGNDFYTYNTTDTIVEYFNQGIDYVQSEVSYTLGDNLENLTLTGLSDISGTGNALENNITGNNANNFLYGGEGNDELNGSLGIDTLIGGTGNDFYFVDSTGDTIVEYFNQGVDEVESSVSYTLGDTLENLILTGSSDISATGNALDNIIADNDGYNSLNGGAGNDSIYASFGDTLFGGLGNDYLESGFGKGTLFGGSGNDTLVGGDEGNDALYGGNGNDIVVGGSEGNDTLTGGAGRDTLTGSGGQDKFNFYSAYHEIDTITDFVVAEDSITVSASGFGGGLTNGAVIMPAQFTIGRAAGDTSERFIYNPNTGALFFDTDGVNNTEQVQFASLSTGLAITNSDIFVIA